MNRSRTQVLPLVLLAFGIWGAVHAEGLPEALRRGAEEALACGEEALQTEHDLQSALRLFEQSLELAERLGDARAMGGGRLRLAWTFLDLGQYDAALDSAREAVELARASGDRVLEGRAWGVVGDAYFYRLEYSRALQPFHHMLDIKQQLQDVRGQAAALKNLGVTYRSLGQLDEALRYLRSAEETYARLGDVEPDVSILHNLGWLYEMLGAEDLALRRYEQALAAAERSRSIESLLNLRFKIADLQLRLGLPELALQQLEAAVARGRGLDGLLLEQALLQEGLAWAMEELGRLPEAVEAQREALRLSRRLGNVSHVLYHLESLGRLSIESDPQAAERLLEEALEVAEANGAQPRWQTYASFGRLYWHLGHRGRAAEAYWRGIEILESHRSSAASERQRSRLMAGGQLLYVSLIDLLLEPAPSASDGAARAFGVLERARARALLQAIAEAGLEREADPELQRQEKHLRGRLAELGKQLGAAADDSDAQALQERLAEAEVELDQLLAASGRKSPGPAAPQLFEPLGPEQAQSLLDSQTALVSYVLTKERVFAFVLTSGSLAVERLPVSPRDLAARVQNGVEILSRVEQNAWPEIGRRLYRDLFEPVRRQLPPRIRSLIVVPDGVLHSLPFEALEAPSGRILVEEYTVSYVPSASVLAELESLRGRAGLSAGAELLAFGVPAPAGMPLASAPEGALREAYAAQGFELVPLPYSAAEVRAIELAVGPGSTIRVDAAATEGALKGLALERFGVLHFATHALLSERAPQRTALVLMPGPEGSEDGFLQAREVYRLRLCAELVVLSACQTARGRIVRGEGVQSLAQAFFHAGARSVVASLWNVQDRSTADFMAAFYRHLVEGKPKAEALRAAKLELLGEPATASPRHWAPFVLIGEPWAAISIRRQAGGLWALRWPLAGLLAVLLIALGLRWLGSGRVARGRGGTPRAAPPEACRKQELGAELQAHRMAQIRK